MNMIKNTDCARGRLFYGMLLLSNQICHNCQNLSNAIPTNHTMHQKYYLRILSLFQNCDKILENTGGGVSNCINVKIKVLENVGGAKVQM